MPIRQHGGGRQRSFNAWRQQIPEWVDFLADYHITYDSLYAYKDRAIEWEQLQKLQSQGRLARICSTWVAYGYVRPARDLDLLRDSLVARGVAHPFGAGWDATTRLSASEVEAAATRVRAIMGRFDRSPEGAREQ